MSITYVTGNYGKYVSVRDKFQKEGILVDFLKYDLYEPEVNDISIISLEKAREVFEIVRGPVFVADSGFYIEAYPDEPNYPGAFVKRSGVSSDIDGLLEKMKDVDNRNCFFLDCLTYYDGVEAVQFFGKSEGTLSREKRGEDLKKAKSNLWFVFVPKNCSKTLAEMDDYERENRPDGRTSATDEFIKWYKENVLSVKKLMKKTK